MKGRYMIFAADAYHPQGGIDDLFGRYDDWQEGLKALAKERHRDIVQVYDVLTDKSMPWREVQDAYDAERKAIA